jgi:hypothetical protein
MQGTRDELSQLAEAEASHRALLLRTPPSEPQPQLPAETREAEPPAARPAPALAAARGVGEAGVLAQLRRGAAVRPHGRVAPPRIRFIPDPR